MGDVMHTRVMLCNAAVQKYHNFRIQLDFFLFCQNFCLNPLRREASRNHSKTPLQRFFLMYEWVARAFQGRFGDHGVHWLQNALAKKKLQCLIVEKNHFNVVDWHCVFNVVDLPWELKEKKNKKKSIWGIWRWHQEQWQSKISDFWCMEAWTSVFFEIEDFGRYERGGLA